MSREHAPRYPSPSSGQVGEAFFNHQAQERVPAPEDLEIQDHLSRRMGPSADQMVHDGHGLPPHMDPRMDPRLDPRMDPRFQQTVHHPQPMQQNFVPMMPAPQNIQAGMQGMHLQHAQIGAGNPTGDDGDARKRHKVSRACDECRRKKIRCDAVSDAPDHPTCSSCHRTSHVCEFTKEPQKRGPSKGYIKTIADKTDNLLDRLESVEKRMTETGSASPSGNNSAMNQVLAPGQKRTHSMLENLPAQAYAQSQLRGSSDESVYPSDGPQDWPGPGASAAAESLRTSQPYNLFNPHAPTANLNSNTDIQDTVSLLKKLTEEDLTMPFLAWQMELVKEYEVLLHPVIPLLGNDAYEILAPVHLTPDQGIRDGFFVALAMVMSCLSATPQHPDTPAWKGPEAVAALNILLGARRQISSMGDNHTSMIILQAHLMVVMALDMVSANPDTADELHQRNTWFTAAFLMAERLRLQYTHFQDTNPMDLVAVLKRRAYLTIVVLDSFHSAGTARPLRFQEPVSGLLPSDLALVGESLFHLARLSRALSHVTTAVVLPKPVSTEAERNFVRLVMEVLVFEFDGLNNSTMQPILAKYPVVRAAFLHLQIFLYRLYFSYHPSTAVNFPVATFDLCRLLDSDEYPRNPLTQHFVTLASHTQMELYPIYTDTAVVETGLKELVHALDTRNILPTDNGKGWKPELSKALKAKLRAMEADSASGKKVGKAPWVYWGKVVHEGYLSAFAG